MSINNKPTTPTNLAASTYSVTPSQLQSIYEEHYQMKQQIQLLKNTLNQCQNKWNNIVNSLLKQNVQLKTSQQYYKNKYHQLKQKCNQKKYRNSQSLIHSQQLKTNQQLKTSHQLIKSSLPSKLSTKQLTLSSKQFPLSNKHCPSSQNRFDDTEISSVQNLWKNYLNDQQEPSFK